MGVVRIGHVRMRMPHRLVHVSVAVFARRLCVVHMVVMAVIVAVCVFVLKRLVLVFVPVGFGQVQHDARQHEHAHCPGPSVRWLNGPRAPRRTRHR